VVQRELERQLPDDWVVICNVAWSRRGPSTDFRYVRDGEADFVVLAPGRGMVILEVKGSPTFRVADDGCWYRGGAQPGSEIRISEAPPDQARRNMHELKAVVEQEGGYPTFPGLFAFVVVYPQGRPAAPLPALFDATTLVTAPQLSDLTSRLRAALDARGPAGVGTQCDRATVRRIAEILTARSLRIVKVDTAADVEEDVDGIDRLTRQQFAALQGVFVHPRAAVVGPAGSGKTVLAMWRLAALLEAGRRALYVCYNRTLAAVLQRRNPAMAEAIRHVDSLFMRTVEEAGARPRVPQREEDQGAFFREELPGLAMDLASTWSGSQRFDAVIVDEGQDFSEAQLIALTEFVDPDNGAFLLFADHRQDLYRVASQGMLGAEVVFSLFHNCRNTRRINDLTNRITASGIPSMPGVPDGVEPIVELRATAPAMAARAWELAKAWHSPDGRVAILSPWSLQRSAMENAPRGHGLRLVTTLEAWDEPDTVLFSTIKGFKGVEAPAVIVTDLLTPNAHPGFREEDLYVACTRPTTRLALLARDQVALARLSAATRP
jgi:hypothetical protein